MMNRYLVFALMVVVVAEAASVSSTEAPATGVTDAPATNTTDAAAAANTTDAPVTMSPIDLNHKLTFPLQFASCLSKHILLIDADNYTFTLDRSKLSEGEHIFINPSTFRSNISSWGFYEGIFNFVDPIVNSPFVSHPSLTRFHGSLILDHSSNITINETIVVEVNDKTMPKFKIASFNVSNPKVSGNILAEEFIDLVKGKTWISSNEANVFYLIENSLNVTTLTKVKAAFKRDLLTLKVNATYKFCEGNNSDPISSDSLFNFAIKHTGSECNSSKSFSSAMTDLENFTGFTDQRYFYLFGSKEVYIFKHQLPSDRFMGLRKKTLNDFFTNGSVPITNGQANVGFLFSLTICLLVAIGANSTF